MKKYYLPDKGCLGFFQESATSEFWDRLWKTEDLKNIITRCKTDAVFIPQVIKYLSKGATVLDGGCGRGYLVNGLNYQGFKGIGVDFAENTIKAVNNAVPELDIRIGDVRNLGIGDNSLDGYISGGVIEHFWDGYDDIINEMSRTIKKGGYLFITFPCMSWLRRTKAKLHYYDSVNSTDLDYKKFYQFALDAGSVTRDLQCIGFELIMLKELDGIKGFKSETKIMNSYLQSLYDGKRNTKVKAIFDKILRVFAPHITLLVMKRM